MRWFRFYDDAINDPKILKLSDKLFRFWTGILCVASKNDGRIPLLEDVALMLRMKPEKAAELFEELVTAGLIDINETGACPHNWSGRQFKSDVSTERVKRFRNGRRNVSVTPPDTESDTERKKDASPTATPLNDETEVYRRGKEILGVNSGGLIKNLVKAKQGSIPHARAAIEIASTKHNPREYIGGIIKGVDPPNDARARGDAW